ncbi:MAG TPA: L-aspartate oxidase [Chloroflexota bacterium]
MGTNRSHYDYVIVGSGGAGLFAALLAKQHGSVLVVTKDARTECNTNYAQGGIAAAIGPGDSPEQHLADTLAAGAGLCHEDAVRILVTEGPARVRDLMRMGLPFDREQGNLALGREGAHGMPRILHAGGDATGRQMELTLDRVAQQEGIEVRGGTLATAIHTEGGTVTGVRLLDVASGQQSDVTARFVLLATGGAGQLFTHTTNPAVATGDGIALAYLAGAEVADMEFYQFHPTALSLPGAPSFLISEAVRGAGAILRTADGNAFMSRYDPRAELASRDIVARAIVSEMERSAGPAYLDLTHLPAAEVRSHFPTISAFCARYGIDIASQWIPVAPAAHYYMGGIVTDTWGETTVRNLFAAGECARSGVHGANRLASNSMLELVVFAHRVVERSLVPLAERRGQPASLPARELVLGHPAITSASPHGATPGVLTALSAMPNVAALRNLLWTNAGIVRHAAGLRAAQEQLATWAQVPTAPVNRDQYELANMVLVGRLLVAAALARQESRGAHARTDYPNLSDAWRGHLTFRAPGVRGWDPVGVEWLAADYGGVPFPNAGPTAPDPSSEAGRAQRPKAAAGRR